ncbi:MAG: DnaJ C-terminal domain-containing protein, partial [Nanoarchaeota archaeon]
HGEGKIIKEKCKTCHGKKTIEKIKTIAIDIPGGVDNGTQLRLAGNGEISEDGIAGDLFVVLHVIPHKIFQREGVDVYLDVPIKFTTAVLGGKIEVPTLNGKAKIKIPAGTQSHTIFRLKGEGIMKLNGYGKGDMFVRAIIDVPKKLDSEQKKLLAKLDSYLISNNL